MHSVVHPHQHVVLRLPSGVYKLLKLAPDMNVSLGKFGGFYSNHIIGRPFYFTYELLDQPGDDGYALRVVPTAELHAEALISEGSAEADGVVEDVEMGDDDALPTRTNRDINDDNSSQTLTLEEIEELKRNTTGAGQEIIERLLESHSSIDKKTAFSLAKYKLRKRQKYLKRFTVLPVDVSVLTEYILQGKDPNKIMELRDEMLGLLGCWGNVHHAGNLQLDEVNPGGRYLVVDDTGGLVVAAMAERMGILQPPEPGDEEETSEEDEEEEDKDTSNNDVDVANQQVQGAPEDPTRQTQATGTTSNGGGKQNNASKDYKKQQQRKSTKQKVMNASNNTITVIHAYARPNLSLLKFFGYDDDNPDESHPLFSHLKTASWLQVLDPHADNIYVERPEEVDEATLKSWKPRQRGLYHRKLARHTRVRAIVDEVRAGGYDGLVVASLMDPESILRTAVPLLAGGASTVVYSPAVESLTRLVDLYSSERRAAYIKRKQDLEKEYETLAASSENDRPSIEAALSAEFTVDPTLILAPMLQTSRVRQWQVLPGRTHPLMSSRGGSEGYVFHATRVLPAAGQVHAHGAFARKKKRKLDESGAQVPAQDVSTPSA
ncbi:tRNA (adenine(58)-N(1))-methyltransferase non-catalytic subunit trm6 [Talaromyces islandicus]|uniref:tRNA (adenine(58)-N(1))-methyltransferase non-catalytic subunit TRM6 n=1 Tax=Talaromyces islandicus TaxID=28573 RepID=A0A0U1MBC3_TALIS|nr:tRNA (adenine(58)-N(1))-methyltransferase non-catalytic subunit trm6 [Talaromyces islandicus]